MSDPRTILLVDDDKFLLDMYAMKFTHEGYRVQTSLSVHEAIEHLKAGLKPDAILFDITMPERDGFDFLQALQAEHLGEGAKKIALTNQTSEAEKAKAIELGVDQYFIKATMIPSEVVAETSKCITGSRAK